jgi:hypothetical protein
MQMSGINLKNHIVTNEGRQYHGSPCGKCGSTLRWAVSRNCVACLREFNAANAKRWREEKKIRACENQSSVK